MLARRWSLFTSCVYWWFVCKLIWIYKRVNWHFWGTKTHTVCIQLKCNIHWHTKCAELLWGLNVKRLFYNKNYLKYAIYMIIEDSCFRAPTIIFNTSQADLLHQWIPKGMGIKIPWETLTEAKALCCKLGAWILLSWGVEFNIY